MNLIILPESKLILDTAFRRARKEAAMLKSQRNNIKDAKGKNIRRIEVSANHVLGALEDAEKGFPSMDQVHPFYGELMRATADIDSALKALGHMKAERRIISRIRSQSIGRIKGLDKTQAREAARIVIEFYGRLSSLVKKLDKSIEKYNDAARKLRELPKVGFDLPTAIIAGYPNTGKSTILGRLTESKPKVASYPFTTQKLQIGHLMHNYLGVQLVDTPGLLDRPLEKRNRIERKAIAALRHLAKAIVFVIDPTMGCGFPLESQAALLKEIRKDFSEAKIIVVLNKADAASPEELEAAKKAFPGALIEGEGIESCLKAKIAEIAGQKGLKQD